MADEPRECPFCGYPPNLAELIEEVGGGWRVTCYTCKIGTWDGAFATVAEAVAAWNTRPTEDRLRADLARLEAALRGADGWVTVRMPVEEWEAGMGRARRAEEEARG